MRSRSILNNIIILAEAGSVLSAGVLGVVEGSYIEFDEPFQIKASPTSDVDPSTTASTLSLRIERAGVGGNLTSMKSAAPAASVRSVPLVPPGSNRRDG